MQTRRSWAPLALLGLVAGFGGCKPSSPSPTDPGDPGPQDPQTYSVTLEWNAPTTDAGGRPLTDLAGYRVHYRDTSPADGTGSKSVDVTDGTSATVSELDAGTWYFTVSALDESGNESEMSNEVSIGVGP